MRRPSANGGVALITGGAGFVGCNLGTALARDGWRVRVYDDLSRRGVDRNLAWLRTRHPGAVELVRADLAAGEGLAQALAGVDAVYHFAAQTAVTTSLERPDLDFRVNLQGTFELLEALRRRPDPPALVFASTNKVYGNLADLPLEETGDRYVSIGSPGIDEGWPLVLQTPYGCSKGAAEQYVLDYGRHFGLRATVLRMSCMYGAHQCGTEDQGWVAHFVRQALRGAPINIFGNGKQVRDILYVDDLVDAQRAALAHMDVLAGRPWNLGGGQACAVSLLEVLALIGEVMGTTPRVAFHPPRPGDQRYYVSDHGAFTAVTGWRPRVKPAEGIRRLHDWLREEPTRTAAVTPAVTGGT